MRCEPRVPPGSAWLCQRLPLSQAFSLTLHLCGTACGRVRAGVWVVCISTEYGQLNCASFVAGIVHGILDSGYLSTSPPSPVLPWLPEMHCLPTFFFPRTKNMSQWCPHFFCSHFLCSHFFCSLPLPHVGGLQRIFLQE